MSGSFFFRTPALADKLFNEVQGMTGRRGVPQVANFTVLSMFLCPDGWWPMFKGFQYNQTKEI